MAKRDDPSDPEDVFWNDGEPIEPVEPAGPGLMRSGGREPWASEGEEDDPGHSWTQLFRDPVREPYGGAAGTGGAAPYGGRRFEHGRDTSAAREDGQLYGRDHRNFGHRRNPYYAGDNAIPWWEVGVPEEDVLEGEEAETAAGRTFAGSRRRHPRRPDARIEEEVLQRLAEAGWLDASGVEVEVSDGVVTLEGEVDGRDARRAAEELAAEVSGVVDVVNRLRPRSPRRPPRA